MKAAARVWQSRKGDGQEHSQVPHPHVEHEITQGKAQENKQRESTTWY